MRSRTAFWAVFLTLLLGVVPAHASAYDKGLFVSVLQRPVVLSDKKAVDELIRYAKTNGYRTLYVQVYRANQAWFPSKHAENMKNEFPYLLDEAHQAGLKVHGWMNLLSLSANGNAPLLKKYGDSILTRNSSKKWTRGGYKIDGQYFLEPGDPRVAEELSAIVEELVRAYPALDGVQFDYIRYPDVKPAYGHTERNLARYKKSGGRKTDEKDPAWRKWKRTQVTSLVWLLRQSARSVRKDIPVSVTGLMTYERAREEAFQDWKEWVEKGLVDFVTLMAYTDDAAQFDRYLQDARYRLPEDASKVNIAIGAYKLKKKPELYRRQWDVCEAQNLRSCVALDYESLLQFK